MRWIAAVSGLVAVALVCVPPVDAQEPGAADEVLNLFFDCQAPGCRDMDFLRREVPFVNWVREREASDVHVLVTSEATGGGGRQYTLDFIGIGDLEGDDQQLGHATPGDATTDEQRSGVAEKLRLGLVRYVAGSSVADRLRVTYEEPAGPGRRGGGPGGGPSVNASAQDDPWDFWTFRISANAFAFGEATFKNTNAFGIFSADRTTEAWKVSFGSSFSQNVREFEIPDEDGGVRTVEQTQENWSVDGALVRSVGERWAIGVRSEIGASDFLNEDFRFSVRPGVEYNIFPYSESSRRSLTLQYLVGPRYWDYAFPTIFDKTRETTLQQSLTGRISLVQPWGRWSTSLTGAQYLHDTSKYSVTLSGNFNIRLFRGFSIRVGGNYTWIRDQLHVSSELLSDEQVLLRQRQLETNFRYNTNFGIEYRFGSIFNNVVNPRFGGGGGGEIFFF